MTSATLLGKSRPSLSFRAVRKAMTSSLVGAVAGLEDSYLSQRAAAALR